MARPSVAEITQGSALKWQQIVLPTTMACTVYFIYALVANGWGLLLIPLAMQTTWPPDTVGLLFVAWSLGYLPGTLLGGSFLDRHGPHHVFLLASFLLFGGMLALLLGLLFHVLFLPGWVMCAGIAGVGAGTIDAAANGLISSIYTQKRGMALNLFTLLYPLSSICASFIDGGLLLWFHNDPRPLLFFSVGIAAFACLALIFSPRFSPLGETSTTQEHTKASHRVMLRQMSGLLPMLLPVAIAMMFTTGFTVTVRTWTPTYLHVTYAQTPTIAAFLSGIMNGLVVVFRLLASWLVGRIGTWSAVLLSIGIACTGFLGTPFSSQVFVGTIALTITAVGLTPLVATFISIGNERAGTWFGSTSGLLLFVIGISNALCSWLFGVILYHAGSTWAVLFCLVSMSCGGIIVLWLRLDAIPTPAGQ